MNKKIQDYPHLERLTIEGYDFRFSNYLSKGMDIFKEDIGGFVSFTFVMIAILCMAGFVPMGTTLLSPALTAGFAIVSYNIVRKQHHEFNEFFKGFDHFIQLFLVSLISGLIIAAMFMPFIIGSITFFAANDFFTYGSTPDFGDFPKTAFWLGMLVIAPVVYLAVSWSWAPFFVIFYKMQFWDAMESSRKILTKNWWIFFIFVIVTGIIAGAGILGFGVGLLFTVPLVACMNYAAFAEVVGLHNENGERSYIEDHLVE
ncbi:MAG: hypothetical protein AAF806_05605 [Bacteroidota bacterium]